MNTVWSGMKISSWAAMNPFMSWSYKFLAMMKTQLMTLRALINSMSSLQRDFRIYTAAMRYGDGALFALNSKAAPHSMPDHEKGPADVKHLVPIENLQNGVKLSGPENLTLSEGFSRVDGWTPQVCKASSQLCRQDEALLEPCHLESFIAASLS